MSISEHDIQRIAKLAKIRLSKQEQTAMQTEMNQIFTMISALCAIDTAGVEPMSHAQDVSLHLRADIVTETNQRDLFQRIAPQTEKGLYLVPQVIE